MNSEQIMGLILALSALFLGVTIKYEAYDKVKGSDKEDSNKNERER